MHFLRWCYSCSIGLNIGDSASDLTSAACILLRRQTSNFALKKTNAKLNNMLKMIGCINNSDY